MNEWEPPTQITWRPPQPYDPYQQGDRFNAPMRQHSEMGAALAYMVISSSYFIGGWLGVKAAKNHHARGLAWVDAAAKGANAGRRWTGWIIALWWMLFMGMFSLAMIDADGKVYDYNGGIHLWAISLFLSGFILWPIMFVIYNRNIDQSLFRRRLVYHLVRPLARVLDRFSSITLYLMIPVAPFAIAVVLDISGVV